MVLILFYTSNQLEHSLMNLGLNLVVNLIVIVIVIVID